MRKISIKERDIFLCVRVLGYVVITLAWASAAKPDLVARMLDMVKDDGGSDSWVVGTPTNWVSGSIVNGWRLATEVSPLGALSL